MAFLNISGVQKRFGHYTALENVNLQVREGEVIALIGHSGSGKSTLLAMIAGLTRPSVHVKTWDHPFRMDLRPRGWAGTHRRWSPWNSLPHSSTP